MSFIRETTFGHGSYGYTCVLCGADDYHGKLIHKEGCLYKAITDEVLRELNQ